MIWGEATTASDLKGTAGLDAASWPSFQTFFARGSAMAAGSTPTLV